MAEPEEPPVNADIVNVLFKKDPGNNGEVMRRNKRAEWQTAMQEEIAALEDSGVLRVIKRSPGSNALHSKWVYKTSTGADGELERQEARPVACGDEQVLGLTTT
uniref:Reverse transcriptase Ty1/copia-type domain-containing protein n=1 Tax=Peronospora matthiolae TaxID=2874970 RepID=A0AAV1TLM1_9STRA